MKKWTKVYCENCKFRKKWLLDQYYCSRVHKELTAIKINKYTNVRTIIDWRDTQLVKFIPNSHGTCRYYIKKPSWLDVIYKYIKEIK